MTIARNPFYQLTKHQVRVLHDRFTSCGVQPRPEDEAAIEWLNIMLKQAAR